MSFSLIHAGEMTSLDLIVRILVAVLIGCVVGTEREYKNRPAGLRTHVLVCLGACMIALMECLFVANINADTKSNVTYNFGRLCAQVISGIGFLGAGTIIVTPRNQIKGLTTAAGLWASACVGLALGIGLYEVALLGSLSIFVIFTLLHELDFRIRHNTRQLDAYVELKEGATIRDFLDFVRSHELEPSNLLLQTDTASSAGIAAFNVTLKSPVRRPHEDIMCILRTLDGIAYIEEL